MKPQEPSQNEKLAKNLFFNFKPPYLKNPFSDFKFFGLYPHYIGYALSCVKISAKSNHKFLRYPIIVNSLIGLTYTGHSPRPMSKSMASRRACGPPLAPNHLRGRRCGQRCPDDLSTNIFKLSYYWDILGLFYLATFLFVFVVRVSVLCQSALPSDRNPGFCSVYIYTCIYLYVYIYMYIYVYICMTYIYMYVYSAPRPKP